MTAALGWSLELLEFLELWLFKQIGLAGIRPFCMRLWLVVKQSAGAQAVFCLWTFADERPRKKASFLPIMIRVYRAQASRALDNITGNQEVNRYQGCACAMHRHGRQVHGVLLRAEGSRPYSWRSCSSHAGLCDLYLRVSPKAASAAVFWHSHM